ncbi:MAG: P-loop NTPase fold protein [Fimbriimonas sp.]
MDTRNDPIAFSDEDRLGRAPTAKVFAKALMANPSRAMTVAVYGPWGSGKTSFANLIQAELRGAGLICAWFNPWQFTNSEALTLAFFDLLSQVVSKSNPKAAQKIREDFHRYASSITSLSLSSDGGGGLLSRRPNYLSEPGLSDQKDALFEHFRLHGRPIVVFVDDIDRLRDSDIRLTIQLVKSNADFPNLKFVLLFQKETVEAALKTEGQSGADFLEKIIEVPIELPLIRSSAYVEDFLKEVSRIFQEQSELGPSDLERWQLLMRKGLLDPFRTLRRKNRLLDRLQLHSWNIQGSDGLDINLVDLLAIEILRSVDYDLYSRVRHYELAVTETGEDYRAEEERRTTMSFLDKMISESGPGEHELGRLILTELFPHLSDDPGDSQQQERDFRISRSRHFSKYFLEGLQLGEMGTSNRKQLEEAALSRGDIWQILVDYKSRGMLFDALDHLLAIAEQIPGANRIPIALTLGRLADTYGTSRAKGFGRSIVGDTTQVIKLMTARSRPEERSAILKALAVNGNCLQVSVALTGDRTWTLDDADLAPNLTRLARSIQTASEDGRLEKLELYGVLVERWRLLNESKATGFARQVAADPIRFTEFARAISPCSTVEAGLMLQARTTHAATASGLLRYLSKRTAVKATNQAIKGNSRPKDAAFLQNLLQALRYAEADGQEGQALFEDEALLAK